MAWHGLAWRGSARQGYFHSHLADDIQGLAGRGWAWRGSARQGWAWRGVAWLGVARRGLARQGSLPVL